MKDVEIRKKKLLLVYEWEKANPHF